MKEAHLYILCGLPFSGKTTLANELVSRLGVSRVAIDDINGERGVWDDETGLSPEEWTNTYQEAYRRINLLLKQGKSVVDDSVNYARELRDRLRAIAERHGAATTVIYVDVPLAEARRRWLENRQTARRADVRDSDFANVVEHFEVPTEDENVLLYDGTISAAAWIDQIFSSE
jgi:predicted kinase